MATEPALAFVITMAGTRMSGEQIKTSSIFVRNTANKTYAKETLFLVQIFLFVNQTFGHRVFQGTLSATEVTLYNG
jgi:hypothetical protein